MSRPVSAVQAFWGSTVGKKAVMAVTGVIMIGFIAGHVLGNLLVFRGRAAMNEYAEFLRSTGSLLWLARAVLLVSVVLHVVAAVQLTRLQRAARPTGYTHRDPQVSTFAARTIRWGGLIILVFVVYHLLHFTFGTAHPRFVPADVYGNVVTGFRVWWVSAMYLVAMGPLGLHLYHGTWSAFRTLGLTRGSRRPLRRGAGTVLAVAVWLGFSAIPIAVLAGFLR